MNETTLKLLEYQRIKEMIEELTVSDMGRDLVRALKPDTDPYIIRNWLWKQAKAGCSWIKGLRSR